MPNKSNYKKLSREIMLRYMENLNKKEAYEMALLSKRWGNVVDMLASLIEELANLPTMSADKLFKLSLYKEFLKTANDELLKYSAYSTTVIKTVQKEFAITGLKSSQELLSLLSVNFNRLPVEAVVNMIGRTQDGSPLSKILLKRYGDSMDKAAQTLIESNAIGRNPIVTARLIGEDINGSLYNTIRIARTEQIDSFREASRDSYIESGIVKGMDLITEPDACPICLGVAANNPYPLDYAFDELHPNCRCAFAPSV